MHIVNTRGDLISSPTPPPSPNHATRKHRVHNYDSTLHPHIKATIKQTKQDETTKRDQTVDSYNFIEYYWYLNNTGLTNLTNLILLIDMQD